MHLARQDAYSTCAEAQYQSLQKLLAEFNAFSARAPNRLLRPAMRPHDATSARRWWRYVAAAVKRQLPSRRFDWKQLEKVQPGAAMHGGLACGQTARA